MSDIDTLEGQWHDLAIDDGDIVLQANEYYAEIDDGTDVISTRITNISYSPSVNKAKNIKIDVPPEDVLETEKYFGETLRVYVDGKLLFEGDIVVIEVVQDTGEDYSIEAEPPFKRMKGDDNDSYISNKPVYDVVSGIIDEYNDITGRHVSYRDTENETIYGLTHLGMDVLEGPGQVSYSSIGNPDTIYIKCYTPSTSSLKTSFETTITDATQNRYGEWYEFNVDISEEIIFTLEGNARLVDWVAIDGHELKRTTHTPEVEESGAEENFYSYSDEELVEEISSADDGITVIDEEDQQTIRSRKITNWAVMDIGSQNLYGDSLDDRKRGFFSVDDDSINGYYLRLKPGQQSPDISSVFDDIHDEEPLVKYGFNMRCKVVEEHVDKTDPEWTGFITINGSTNERFFLSKSELGADDDSTEMGWFHLAPAFISDDIEDIDEFVIGTRKDSEITIAIDTIILAHRQWDLITFDNTLDYTFDNEVDEEGNVKRPVHYATSENYGEPQYVEFENQIATKNISSASTEVTFEREDSNIIGQWGVEQSINFLRGKSYVQDVDENESVSDVFAYPGGSHSVRVALSGRTFDGGTSPLEGDLPQILNSINVDASFNDLDIISDEDIADNRLSAVNSLCNDSDVYVRFDGDTAQIFQRGLLKANNIDLYKESVSSSRDISEVYRSCLVKGKHGVTGNRIVAEEAPEYVKKDKTILDRSIESVEGCNSQARSFLKEHGNVDYSGDITTLPTMAPVGEMMDGSNFLHGQDMIINSVRYGKRRSSISLGFEEDIANQLIETAKETQKSNKEGSREGMIVPTGQGSFQDRGE